MANLFYHDTVTVYNRLPAQDPLEKETWYVTLLINSRLMINKGANITKTGNAEADAAKLFLRDEFLTKQYLDPLVWIGTIAREDYFTLESGTSFFVEGDTTSEDKEQADFFSYMKKKYDNCFQVTTVDRYGLIPHFEVGGK